MGRKIVVIRPGLEEVWKEKIRRIAAEGGMEVSFFETEKEAGDEVLRAEVIYGFAPETARNSDSLLWLNLPSAGADAFVKPGAIKNEKCILTNSSGAYGVTLAEHMVMVTLMLLRQMPVFMESFAKKQWHGPMPQQSIRDARVTLLGAGDIGVCYARRVRSFEPASITAVTRSGVNSDPVFDRVVSWTGLDEILPETDILAMSLPSTPQTIGILSRERIFSLPENAVVINVGRGSAIDEEALIDALNQEKIAGAALDVMQQEPLPAEHPLWNAKHVLITPHVGGNLTLPYTRNKNAEQFCENLKRYLAGEPLGHVVNRSLGY